MPRTWQRADKSDFTIVNEGNNVYRADEVVEQPKSEIKPEQQKVGEPKVEQPKSEVKPEQLKVDELKAEQPKAEQPKVDEPKVEQPKSEVKPEQPKVGELKAEQPKVGEPKVEQPKVEQPKAEVKPETPKQTSKSSSQPAKSEDNNWNPFSTGAHAPSTQASQEGSATGAESNKAATDEAHNHQKEGKALPNTGLQTTSYGFLAAIVGLFGAAALRRKNR